MVSINVTKIREYDLTWHDADIKFAMKGNPSRNEITDFICQQCSKGGNIYIDARFEAEYI